MGDAKKIQTSFKKLYEKIKSAKEISEEDVRVAFVKSGILEELGYEGELKDIRFEKDVKGKRSDLLAFDEYKNVVFAVEFKTPDAKNLDEHFAQLWERYVKPLKAKYGLLTNGLELLIYERINSNWERKPKINLSEITLPQCEEIFSWLKKPKIERTKVDEVLKYFERFDKREERINLSSEIAQKHFFDSFELKEGSVFVDLLQATIGLFDSEIERSKFLRSAYEFWKTAYAKKPEKIPENWKKIMEKIGLETSGENLFKFMFCLESAYSLFTRLILAKACEDYKLPYVDFSKFIKTEIERISYRGDITLLAWAIISKNLIDGMKQKLVKSVFEGDLFYWWEDSYKELGPRDALYSPKHEKQRGYFGEAIAEITLTLYKFDFSEIVGDPLGTLYQRYFDKETRKALGEFYTPREVVEYIVDAVGYEGRGIIGKRLLDPACGSGTFLVEALKRYLRVAKESGEEMNVALKRLCNEFHIVGFDIHPFATFMAQMQFMLVLIPAYKKAIEGDRAFVLNRLPIFRTDSLVDETKGEAKKVTLETFENGTRFISIDTGLPVNSGNLKIKMPYDKDVFSKTDLLNVQEYFAALQAVFDTVKESAWQEKYEVDKQKLERNFKQYLPEKDWNKLISFFTPYAYHFLDKFRELKETFGDGRLIKSIEDIILAALLKNYVKYDFVVGNPPYVNIKRISEEKRKLYKNIYDEVAYGRIDLYILFISVGISWLDDKGVLGFITSNKFILAENGKKIRKFITDNCKIEQLIDFGDSGVFADATNYPSILIFKQGNERNEKASICNVKRPKEDILKDIAEKIGARQFDITTEYYQLFQINQPENNEKPWRLLLKRIIELMGKLDKNSVRLNVVTESIREAVASGADSVFIVDRKTIAENRLEEQLLLPFVFGEDVRKWSILWKGLFLIYPYIEYEGVKKKADISNYPNTEKFLTRFQDILKDRYCVKKGGKEYFEHHDPSFPTVTQKEKIVTPDISDRNHFAYDAQGLCFKNTCYVIVLKGPINGKYLCGILNSNVLEFYFKQISPFLSGEYYRYKTQYLENLPIKLPKTKLEQKLADKITQKVEQILEKVKLGEKIEKFPDEYIQEYRSRGEEFDSINISFTSDHKAIEPSVEKNIDGEGYNILIKKEKSIFVESKVKASYVATTLKGKSAKKDEKKQLLIPKSDLIVEKILNKLKEDEAATMSPSVAGLEEEINQLVYKLYGLNEEDIKVIEDFLKRF